jgi:hypothetical protein
VRLSHSCLRHPRREVQAKTDGQGRLGRGKGRCSELGKGRLLGYRWHFVNAFESRSHVDNRATAFLRAESTAKSVTIERAVQAFTSEFSEYAAPNTHKKYKLILAKLISFSQSKGAREMGPYIFAEPKTTDMNVVTDVWRRKLNKLWGLCGLWREKPTPHRFRHTLHAFCSSHVHGFDALQRSPRRRERAVTLRQPSPLLHCPMVLLQHIIEVFALTQTNPTREDAFGFQRFHGGRKKPGSGPR